ncbi:hypothetical protein RHSP_55699 [Rhizobium freirei PRF 81]|uniref:Uncharacterized protein n=1 Tax=Rhizobium freirei PRF 81 TaxID=363754 RepID=N6U4G2_9HYPH|nr:hypothetical protein RHSP_55699 [Rhizobium freirei PRF 81]
MGNQDHAGIVELDQMSDRQAKGIAGPMQDADRRRVSERRFGFEIVHGTAGKTFRLRHFLDRLQRGYGVEAAALAAAAGRAAGLDGAMGNLAGAAVIAAIKLAADEMGAADTVIEGDDAEVPDIAGAAEQLLADRDRLRIVLDKCVDAAFSTNDICKRHILPAKQGGLDAVRLLFVDEAGKGDAEPVELLGGILTSCEQLRQRLGDQIGDNVRIARERHGPARNDIAVEVAEDHRCRIFEQGYADKEGAFRMQIQQDRRATLAMDRLRFVQYAKGNQIAGNSAHGRLAQTHGRSQNRTARWTGLADDPQKLLLRRG